MVLDGEHHEEHEEEPHRREEVPEVVVVEDQHDALRIEVPVGYFGSNFYQCLVTSSVPGSSRREAGVFQLLDEEQAADAEGDDGEGEVDEAQLVHRLGRLSTSFTEMVLQISVNST